MINAIELTIQRNSDNPLDSGIFRHQLTEDQVPWWLKSSYRHRDQRCTYLRVYLDESILGLDCIRTNSLGKLAISVDPISRFPTWTHSLEQRRQILFEQFLRCQVAKPSFEDCYPQLSQTLDLSDHQRIQTEFLLEHPLAWNWSKIVR